VSSALTDEERLLQATAREFAQRELAPGAIERDEAERYDRSLFAAMGALGLTAAPFPAAMGGAGFSYLGWTLVMEELGAADMAMAVSLSVHILSQYPVVSWGTDEQRARWLPAMQTGEALGAFALTEPHAGSDAAAIRTRAERVGAATGDTGQRASAREPASASAGDPGERASAGDPGQRASAGDTGQRASAGDTGQRASAGEPASASAGEPVAYRLSGTKIWISNAPEADRYLVFATVDPDAGSSGITAFLVEKGTPGFRFGAHERKMGIRSCPAAELVFEGCEVPAANRLGAEGDGYRIALSALAEGRISIAAACVGLARAGLDAAAGYLGERRAFGGPLSDQQGLRFMLAEMARDVAAARALTREAAIAKDRGEPLAEVSSLAKWTASDVAMRVATDAVQLFGGTGYSRETGVERLMRDAKGAQIYEGTNQIHREIVAGEILKRSGSA
jgi:alkylation response protein AidB-like acyl-CoA dehydrogenase